MSATRTTAATDSFKVVIVGGLLTLLTIAGTQLAQASRWIVFWDNAGWTIGYATGAAAAWCSSKEVPEFARLRRFTAYGLAAFFVGQLFWNVQVYIDWNPFPGPSDLFFLLTAPLTGVGLFGLLRSASSGVRRAVLLDAVSFGLLALALSFALYLPRGRQLPLLTLTTMIAYPSIIFAIVGLQISITLELRIAPLRRNLAFLAALLLHAYLWMQWNLDTLAGSLGDGRLLNFGFSLGTIFYGYATSVYEPKPDSTAHVTSRAYYIIARTTPIIVSFFAALAMTLAGTSKTAAGPFVVIAAALSILVALVRQLLLVEERDRLIAAESANLKLREKLSQAQKLEALGTLAGGIAHDFNNILVALQANAELLAPSIPESAEARESLAAILSACRRARDVTRQVFAFSKRQQSLREVVHPGEIVQEVTSLLRAALPPQHEIVLSGLDSLPPIYADAVQLHQVITNLAMNSSRAIGERPGVIQIEGAILKGEPTDTVVLRIRDNGAGMDENTQRRMFEPFFTTREGQGGTGLGLSVVHGIVTDHGGTISCTSHLGEGTTIEFSLPATKEHSPASKTTVAPLSAPSPSKDFKVLVVDDDIAIGRALVRLLARIGYQATPVASAEDAIATLSQSPKEFDVVITDQLMPGMTGTELLPQLLAIAPHLRGVLSSGTELPSEQGAFASVLPKPYTLGGLQHAIEVALET